MTNESELLHQQRQAEVRRMAAIIRQIEQVIPGCFGEAAAVIRQQAAGDDVAPDDLTAALASVRLTIQEAAALQEWNTAQGGRKAAGMRSLPGRLAGRWRVLGAR